MNKLSLTAVVAVLSFSSVAMADRGDRYSRSRSDASVRYERGSGGDYHNNRSSYRGRDSGHRDYGGHSRSRSSFSFGFGISSGGYYGDRSHLGFGYSRGYSRGYDHGYRYSAPRYYRSDVIIAPAPIYIAPPPVVYERRTYYAPSYYGGYSSYGGYYCR